MKGVRHPRQVLHSLHERKQRKQSFSSAEKIKVLIEKELHTAQSKHDRAVRRYVASFSIALVILTILYLYYPQIPKIIIVINLLAALGLFFFGLSLLSNGYKREISDYLTIEEQVEKLRR